jgi:hypothetical protein
MKIVTDRLLSWIPDFSVLLLACLAQTAAVAVAVWQQRGYARRRALYVSLAVSCVAMFLGLLLRSDFLLGTIRGSWAPWLRSLLFAWTLLSLVWAAGFLLIKAIGYLTRGSRFSPRFNAARRGFLGTAYTALFAAPAATLAYGTFLERRNISLREHDIPVAGLAPDLNGLRLVQLTDIHMSPFFSRRELDYAVALANETRAQIALVTGDLITTARDPLDSCLAGLKPLRADAGVFGCMGNHEKYAHAEAYAEWAGARQGLRFLRRAAQLLTFGDARINLAGVDYQRLHAPYLRGAERWIVPGAYNIMLSHNPDVFDVAARQGYDLTVAGHTHGGQVRVEILGVDFNAARFYTPYVDGIYTKPNASIFVSRGLGTIGIPTRVGAPPEVTLLRLCRI